VEVAAMLEATGLVKRYGQVTALDRFTLSVAPGEITGLVGHNGAGKTTFARIVAGLAAPDAGHVTIAGLPPRRAAHLVGVAPQEISLYPEVTVREALRLFGGLHGLRRKRLSAATGEVTGALCLGGFLDQRIASLSGGQQRRVQAAAALLHRPPLLLLDEPTAGVDPQTRLALLAALRQRAADGAAIVYTTHYLPELTDLQATLAVARDGRVIARGTAAATVRPARPGHRRPRRRGDPGARHRHRRHAGPAADHDQQAATRRVGHRAVARRPVPGGRQCCMTAPASGQARAGWPRWPGTTCCCGGATRTTSSRT
jgi:ABC-2 type transport system ATP-binding protein